MTREEFYILSNLYDASVGRAQSNSDIALSRALQSKTVLEQLIERKLVDGKVADCRKKD